MIKGVGLIRPVAGQRHGEQCPGSPEPTGDLSWSKPGFSDPSGKSRLKGNERGIMGGGPEAAALLSVSPQIEGITDMNNGMFTTQ